MKRIEALDVMRGIAVAAMILFNNPGQWGMAYAPLRHAVWFGLTPTDLAYPFFMFMMGVAMCFSLRKFAERKGPGFVKIVKRTVLLFLLGVLLGNFGKLMSWSWTWENTRIMGVLQRLAVVYFFGAIIYLYVPRKWHLPLSFVLLAGFIALLKCFNGYVHSEENLLARVDLLIMGRSHMYVENVDGAKIAFEPESLVGTFSGIAHVLLGAHVGGILLSDRQNTDKVRETFVFGTLLLFAGFLLQYLDPICKKIWTSSYVLVTCGAASLLLALLMNLIDVRGVENGRCIKSRSGIRGFFKVFGTNAIVAYTLAAVVSTLLGKWGVKKAIYAGFLQPVFGDQFGSLVYSLLYIGLICLMVLPLYKKKIFVRL